MQVQQNLPSNDHFPHSLTGLGLLMSGDRQQYDHHPNIEEFLGTQVS